MKSHQDAVLVFFAQPERIYWSLTPELETVVIEVSTVQALMLRANPQRWHGAIHLPYICYQGIGPTVTQDFTVTKLAILT